MEEARTLYSFVNYERKLDQPEHVHAKGEKECSILGHRYIQCLTDLHVYLLLTENF